VPVNSDNRPEVALPRDALIAFAREAFELGETLNWKSHDPYDLLLTPFARNLRQRSSLLARLLLQVGRRSGSRLRRLLRVPVHEEPKALADFLQAATLLSRLGEEWAARYTNELSVRLRARAAAGSAGHGWGLGFPSVTRFISVAAGEPNIYTTTCACQALLDHHEATQDPASLEAAFLGAQFIRIDLGSFTHGGRMWLRYSSASTGAVINVQASAASLFARLGRGKGSTDLLEAADSAAETVISSQGADGSWTYSADEKGAFIDGFHTGFTLQGLQEYHRQRRQRAASGTTRAIDAGFTYFKKHLLTSDGLPLGFADGRVNLDGQNLAQCINTLLACGDDADGRDAGRLWRLAVEQHRVQVSPFPALRWRIGPLVLATAALAGVAPSD
jgi:polysaccharide biosynthesis protein VpsJ